MKLLKIAGAVAGLLLIAAAIVGAYGLPARTLIESSSRDALAKNNLKLDIGGDARLAIWPRTGLTLGQARLSDAASGAELVTIERVTAAVALPDLVRGRVRVRELALTRPVARVVAMSGRARPAAERRERGAVAGVASPPLVIPGDAAVAIDAVSVEDGVLMLREGADTVEVRIDSLRLAALPAAGGRPSLRLDARLGSATVRLTAGVDNPARLAEGEAVPIEITFDAPGVLKGPASLTATVAKTGPTFKIAGMNGRIDQGRIRGAISVSFAGAKPFIDATLESERLDLTGLADLIGAAQAQQSQRARPAAPPAAGAPAGRSGAEPLRREKTWSETPLNLFGLRLVEGSVIVSAREVAVRDMRVAPAALEATLLDSMLTVKLSPSGLYGGQAAGELVLDRASDDPQLSLKLVFSDLDALPFLRDAIDFPYVSGRARGAFDLKSAGASPLQIVSGLNGRAELLVEDGALRGLNLPSLVRSLLDMIIAGWGSNASEETRFSRFAGTFAVENGVARSTDVRFTGPFIQATAAGSVDLAARTLDFRTDPKLVSSSSSSSPPPVGRANGWSIGVPVAIQGPWSAPRIYADAPNVLANPEGALRALRNALGGDSSGGQADALIGRFIENLSKGLGRPGGDSHDGGAIADEMFKAFGKSRGLAPPQPEITAPRTSGPETPASRGQLDLAPSRDYERGARDLLREFFNR